jgi:AcrR family transcriptional regulator
MTGTPPPGTPHIGAPFDHTDGRIVRGDSRRAAILEAATREFGRRGYESARIADIARASGVTDAGLLHHFSTKRDLFLAVIELREQVYAPMQDLPPATAREFFDGFIASVVRAERDPDLLRFRTMLTGATGLVGHPAHGRAHQRLKAALDGLEPFLHAAIDRGELRADTDPHQVVLELFALNDGLRSQWAAWPEVVDYAETFTAAANALYERIAAR